MKRIGSGILAAAALAALVGCGRTPLAPLLDSVETAPTPVAAKSGAQPNALQPPYVAPDPSQPDRTQSTMVNGGRGAVFQAGHVTLIIPKHAFSGRARVTMEVPDVEKLEAKMHITPAEKNKFTVPVTVEFDAAGCGEDARLMRVMWLDPQTNEWVQIASSPDAATGKLTAQLTSFSSVRAECDLRLKSGW